eukprot:CAMPEP_0204560670 /NCGR_PEP_ID=MMETSP0661-20131031/32755_1 /ASSEMBLY_ACC=CAM_ASM_000606 /TAXON_ID=109239 /ORGANISM="Alexandrium margalefi, Strain AMGDE01CS-322" /LENGTH=43 /DNA_ID= /DNA_START= /DNA_END= /DNA_ORIENTATION=
MEINAQTGSAGARDPREACTSATLKNVVRNGQYKGLASLTDDE